MSEATKPADELPKKIQLSGRRKKIEVEIDNDDGMSEVYFLKEMSIATFHQWQDLMNGRTTKDEKGNTNSRMEDLYPDLVGRCLHDSKGVLVPMEKVRQMPAELVEELYVQSYALHGMKKEKTNEKKEKPS